MFYNDDLEDHIGDAGVIHLGDNISNHSVIYVKVQTGNLPRIINNSEHCPKQNWKSATQNDKNEYRQRLRNKLENIHIPECIIDCRVLLTITHHRHATRASWWVIVP